LEIGPYRFPVPDHLLVIYRFHRKVKFVETRSFKLDELLLHITTEPVDALGQLRHLGILAQPSASG